MSRTAVRSREVLILLFEFAVTTPHHRCSVANMSWVRLVSVGFVLTILGVLARGANCTNVHLSRLIAGVKEAGLDAHDIFLASGSADVLVCESVTSHSAVQRNGQTDGTHSVRRADGLLAPSHELSGDGARQWSRVILGAQQSWWSLNP